MSIATILLHLDGGKRDALRTDVATQLAAQHDAHVIGLHVAPRYYPLAYGGPGAVGLAELQQQYMRATRERADDMRARFEEATDRAGIANEWRFEEGEISRTVALHARYADLTILGQVPPESEGPYLPEELGAEVAIESGRPVLTIPYIGEVRTLGDRVLIAWNGSREAARAVHEALPILTRARSVTVLVIQPRDQEHLPGADIANSLARHGVKVNTRQTAGEDISVGDMLLSEAANLNADLIVMGAYGHSRFREFVLGGVTRLLLASMTVPVFMAH